MHAVILKYEVSENQLEVENEMKSLGFSDENTNHEAHFSTLFHPKLLNLLAAEVILGFVILRVNRKLKTNIKVCNVEVAFSNKCSVTIVK